MIRTTITLAALLVTTSTFAAPIRMTCSGTMEGMKDGKPTGATTPIVGTVYVDIANKTVSITNLTGDVLVNTINKTTDENIEFSGDDRKAFMTGGSLNRFTGEYFLRWHNREMWMSQFQQGAKPIPFDAQVLSQVIGYCKAAQKLF